MTFLKNPMPVCCRDRLYVEAELSPSLRRVVTPPAESSIGLQSAKPLPPAFWKNSSNSAESMLNYGRGFTASTQIVFLIRLLLILEKTNCKAFQIFNFDGAEIYSADFS